MASQALKQRARHDQPPPISAAAATNTAADRRKMAMAKKGLRSLALAVLVPLVLAALSAYLSGCSVPSAGRPDPARRASWLSPPVWAFHLASVTTSSLMGLAAWLVWAEGAFHRDPTLLPLYAGQLVLGLLWGPAVFGLGWARAGLAGCVASFVAMLACAERFRKVNTVAGELVKPCLAWTAFLAVFTYSLI